MSKTNVATGKQSEFAVMLSLNPLFADLAKRTGKTPQWNFHKYVIDRTGNPVASFTSQVEPNDRALVSLIEKLLAEQPRRG